LCLLIPSDYKFFTPIIKYVDAKRRAIVCRICKRRLKRLELYIWFHTHSREILEWLSFKSTAKAPSLGICLCIDCWLKYKSKLKKLASTGYEVLK